MSRTCIAYAVAFSLPMWGVIGGGFWITLRMVGA